MRDYAMFVTGINTGLRNGDLKSLKIGDVQKDGKIVDRIYIHEKKLGRKKYLKSTKQSGKHCRNIYPSGVEQNRMSYFSRAGKVEN